MRGGPIGKMRLLLPDGMQRGRNGSGGVCLLLGDTWIRDVLGLDRDEGLSKTTSHHEPTHCYRRYSGRPAELLSIHLNFRAYLNHSNLHYLISIIQKRPYCSLLVHQKICPRSHAPRSPPSPLLSLPAATSRNHAPSATAVTRLDGDQMRKIAVDICARDI